MSRYNIEKISNGFLIGAAIGPNQEWVQKAFTEGEHGANLEQAIAAYLEETKLQVADILVERTKEEISQMRAESIKPTDPADEPVVRG